MSAKPLGAIENKREMISRANSTVFIAVTISAVIVVFCLISLRFLWQKKAYNDRVISAKTKARKQIEDNGIAIDKLSEQFPDFQHRATNNDKTILHALPPAYDYAALVTSMEFLANQAGVKLDSGIGEDISASAVKEQNVSVPQEITLNLSVSGRYENIVKYIDVIEKSIRPVIITTVDFSGGNSEIKATIMAKTYYQPARTLDVSKEVIK
jgi:Tfp pilus assembly protein PilO